jgi:hypothetical protein
MVGKLDKHLKASLSILDEVLRSFRDYAQWLRTGIANLMPAGT